MKFGEIVKQLRKSKGLSGNELAKRSGVSQTYLWQLEANKNNNPTPEVINKLAKGLDISYIELVQETEYFKDLFNKEVDKTASSIVENEKKYAGNSFDVEKLFTDTTNIEYKGIQLNAKEKQQALSLIKTLLLK